MAEQRGRPELRDLVLRGLGDADAVAYRHEVFRDLEAPGLGVAAERFSAGMAAVHGHLARAARMPAGLEATRWRLEAAAGYRDAVAAFAAALDAAAPASRGLGGVRDALLAYLGSPGYVAFDAATAQLLAGLAGVSYDLRIGEDRITVSRHREAPDYGAEIQATFARFGRAEARPVPVNVFLTETMNEVEAAILARIARLHPAVFAALATWGRDHASFLHEGVDALAGELAFYLGYLGLIAPLRAAGLPFCYPEVSGTNQDVRADGLFDLALALRRVPAGEPVIGNDLDIASGDRRLVLTGPSQAGKTTFARAIGQLHHLAAIGCPVPAAAARVPLVDAVHTHFDRPENPADLAGRLEADLRRFQAILESLTGEGLLIMNDSFASTTLEDALALNRSLLDAVARRGARCVAVTFLGELAAAGAATVSMACVPNTADPIHPTFRLERRPPDGLVRARAIADLHRLGYAAVRERVGG